MKFRKRKIHCFQAGAAFAVMSCFFGCSVLDPTGNNQSPAHPGAQWDPDYSEWYCTKRLMKKQESFLPEFTENTDVAELLDIALRNHPETKQAWEQARSCAFALGAAQSAWFPEITGVEGFEYRNTSGGGIAGTSVTPTNPTSSFSNGSFVTGETESLYWDLSISYLLWDYGGRRASIESARQALYAANWTQNRTIQEVIINVIQGYYNYVSSKELLLASESDLKNSQEGLAAADALFQSGVGKYLDVLQSKSNVADKELSLIQAKGQVEIYLAQLATALGVPPSTKIDTKKLPDEFPVDKISGDVEDLMEMARIHRPDLASAWAAMLQKKQDIQVQISSSLPTVTSSVYLEKSKYIKGTSIVTHYYNSDLQINFPIFQGFNYINLIRKARADYKAAKANYDNLESLALLDVVTGYTNFISAKEALVSSREYLKYSGESRDVAFESYKAGTSNFLDLLAADAALAEAKSRNITARANLGVALFNIAFSTGMLNIPFVAQSISKRESVKHE